MTVNTPVAPEPQGYQAYQAYSSAEPAAPPVYQNAPPIYQAGYQGAYNPGYQGGYPANGIPLASGSSPYPGYVQGGYAAPPQVVYSGTSPRGMSGDVAIVYVPGSGYGSDAALLGSPLAPPRAIEDTCPIFLFVLGFCFPILWCGGWLFVSRRFGSTTRIFGALSAALSICAVAATIIVIIMNVNNGPSIDEYASSSSSSSYF